MAQMKEQTKTPEKAKRNGDKQSNRWNSKHWLKGAQET